MSNLNQHQNDFVSYHVPIPTHVYTTTGRKQSINQQGDWTACETSSIKSGKRTCWDKIKLAFYIGIIVFLILLILFIFICFVVMLFSDERPWRRKLFHSGHSSSGSAMSTGESSTD
ncbi:unnamed protein product [Meloidogyne enterolobii]|uniref:Uncharacterized protein n=1 Tax=Meloidogyne enterolobii TaxID=390850 RepID=A0ACB0ZSN7_MELEN